MCLCSFGTYIKKEVYAEPLKLSVGPGQRPYPAMGPIVVKGNVEGTNRLNIVSRQLN